jgi:hypothetical protein
MVLIAGAADYALAEDNCGKFKTVEKSCTSRSCSNTVTLGGLHAGSQPLPRLGILGIMLRE